VEKKFDAASARKPRRLKAELQTQPRFRPLPRAFFLPSAEQVAPHLLGHYLVRRAGDTLAGGIIVEVEAYLRGDPACHAFKGQTNRAKSMWGPPGHCYVYQIYGFHFCMNTVCMPEGTAEGILLRALQPLWGIEKMRERRKDVVDRHLTSGPGKLCAALAITRELDGTDLCSTKSPVFVAENSERVRTLKELGPIVQTTRIGISQAAEWPLRWYFQNSHHVSKK
jgi:DNA-3-methyladenine glycosylase